VMTCTAIAEGEADGVGHAFVPFSAGEVTCAPQSIL
jgi:hypothetical protein